jgi:chromosome partitioning protein
LGLVTQNCLIAANYVLVPVELSKYGIQGLATLTRYFEKAIKQINKEFKLLGVVMNKVDNRKSVTIAGKEVIKKLFGDYLTDAFISTDANIESAQWNDEPVLMYDKNSKSAKQFINLANEVIERVKD